MRVRVDAGSLRSASTQQSNRTDSASQSLISTTMSEPCEVVLVGCGAPSRGMGWYHAEQLLKGKCPSAKLCYIVEPWFLGAGTIVRTTT